MPRLPAQQFQRVLYQRMVLELRGSRNLAVVLPAFQLRRGASPPSCRLEVCGHLVSNGA